MGREIYGKIRLLCSYHTCRSAAKCLVVGPGAPMDGRVNSLEAELHRELSEDKSEPTYHLCFRISPRSPSGINGRCFTSASQVLSKFLFWQTLRRILGNRVLRLTKMTTRSSVIPHFSDLLQRNNYSKNTLYSLSLLLHLPSSVELTLISISSPPHHQSCSYQITDLCAVRSSGVFSVLVLFGILTACDKTDYFLLKTLFSHGI